MCRFGNGTECLLNDVAGSERDSDRDRWMLPTTALGLSRSRTARPRQSRPSEPKHHGGVLALRHHGGGWDRDHVAQPLSHAWPTQVGANLVGRHLAEMGGIVIWRIIWCRAGRGGGECMPAASPQCQRTTPAASSSAGWSLCAGSSTSSTSPCPKRSGSSRSSQTESTSTGCASAAGWPPGTPHFPPLDPPPHPPRIHPSSPPSHSTQALLRLP